MKNIRQFEWIINKRISDGLSDQTRLSKRGKVANNVVGSCYVILLHKAESHLIALA